LIDDTGFIVQQMRTTIFRRAGWLCLLLLSFANAAKGVDAPKPLEPVPSKQQLAWHEDELTMFVHFGMNTFTGRGTGLGTEDEKTFNPTELDCRQWVRAAKAAGYKGIILTAKHHDGFCLWPTKTTEHSVAKSAWKDGKGDVVREFSDACKEFGMKMGIYCSPWDRSVSFYDSDKPRYAEMYRQQLTELLSKYGPVYEMWFDGNKANVADWQNVIATVRKLQPDAVIKQGARVSPISEDVRWVGNEQACAPIENWCVYPAPGATSGPDAAPASESIWFPVECDTMMTGHWFWDENPPRDLPTLLNFYYTSVGRGSILMLNVAPDRRGLFPDDALARMKEFKSALDQTFSKDLAAGKKIAASNVRGNDPKFAAENLLDGKNETYWATDDNVTNASVEVDLGGEVEFNVVRIEEVIELGQRVGEYKIEAFADGSWREIGGGKTIGHRKLDRVPKISASKVRLTIVKSRACPVIRSFGLHLDTVSPAEFFEPALANKELVRGTRATSRQSN
jgi:alpha-L-fucosidase